MSNRCLLGIMALAISPISAPSCDAQTTSSPGVDFSAIDAFWSIHDELLADREPTEASWSRLFNTPGLAALEKREGRREELTRAYRLAYMPSRRDSLKAALAGGGFLGFALPHLMRVTEIRDRLVAFRHELGSVDLLGEARANAATLLPAGLASSHPPPDVAFVFFAPDGRGYPGLIVADLLHIMESRDRIGFFAHELHHHYRNQVAVLEDEFTEDDFYWMYVLINLEEEGTADQLDKADLPALSDSELRLQVPDARRRDFFERYRRHYTEANDWLQRIDEALQRAAVSPTLPAEEGKALHEALPIGGRPVGAFMASMILEKLGREQLAAAVGDPFAFWRLYNEAAAWTGGAAHVLSPEALRVVDTLEARYARRESPADTTLRGRE